MSFDPELESDSTSTPEGDSGGSQSSQADPGTSAAPTGRTYSEAEYNRQFADARRAWEYNTQQQIQRERQKWEREMASRQTPPAQQDPWSGFDPEVQQRLRAAIEAELEGRTAPLREQLQSFQQRQDDIALRNDEAQLSSRFPDYQKNRAAVLEFAVANGIPNVEAAFHAWRSMYQWPDVAAIERSAVSQHVKRKVGQSVRTPSVEGRGGGAPSSKQDFKDRDEMDAAAAQIFRDAFDE